MNPRFNFRVWDKYTHETPAEQMQFLCFNGCLVDSDGCHHSPDDYIIEQCTGLKDKNGNLIYEGDIVVKTDRNALGYGRVRKCQVIWDKKLALFAIETEYGDGYALSDFEPEQYEIIGNRHEQKE